MPFQGAEAFPRIFAEIADADVKGGASPDFEGEKAYLVNLFRDRNHGFGSHAGRHQGLMGVPEGRVGESDFFGQEKSHVDDVAEY
jgi:hypothetical protein